MKDLEEKAIQLIKAKMKEKGWNNPDLAKRLGVQNSTPRKMVQSNRIRLNRLCELSELFNYNFLRVLADELELDNPPKCPAMKPEDQLAYEQRIRELEIENAVLLKVLGK